MTKYQANNFKRGWFIGNFEPSLLKNTQFEVAFKEYQAGDTEAAHTHQLATEYTIIASGVFQINDTICRAGDIIKIDVQEAAHFLCLETGATVVIKTPSVPGDKYLI